jgi:hypothetical protein
VASRSSRQVSVPPPRAERKSIDPEDASRLSFLAYTIEHYNDVKPENEEVEALVGGLKTDGARKIAAALRGEKSSAYAKEAAGVFRDWIKANARR